jgi:hypothetical protein
MNPIHSVSGTARDKKPKQLNQDNGANVKRGDAIFGRIHRLQSPLPN